MTLIHSNRTYSLVRFVIAAVLLVCLIGLVSNSHRTAILNTFVLGLGANLIAIPTGIILGRVCVYTGWVAILCRLFCLGFLFVPLFVHVSAWDAAVGKLGWLTNASWSVNTIPLGNWTLAIWIHGLAAIPQVAVVFWYGFTGSVRIHEEQAKLDASSNAVFWQITLPRMLPLVMVCSVWVFVICGREIAVTDIYRIGTLAEQIYLGYSLGEVDAIVGPTFAMSAFAILAALMVFAVLPYMDDSLFSSEQLSISSPRRLESKTQSLLAILTLVTVVVIPTINLITRASRFVENVDQTPIAKYSISNFARVVTQVPELFASEFYWSSLIAMVSCFAIVTISTLLVWLSLESRFWRMLLISVFVISCSLPGPVIGSLVLWLRSSTNIAWVTWLFDRTIFAPVISNLIFCFPISLILVWFVLRNTAKDVLEHASTEGATSFQKLLHLVLSGNKTALSGVLIISFSICFGELSASQLAVPPGIDTIPRRMLGMLHSGVNDHTAGLTIVSVLFTMLLVGTGYVFVYWNGLIRKQ